MAQAKCPRFDSQWLPAIFTSSIFASSKFLCLVCPIWSESAESLHEDVFWTNFTGQILSECSGDVRQVKAAIIIEVDKEQHLVKCNDKAFLIVDVAKSVGWSSL